MNNPGPRSSAEMHRYNVHCYKRKNLIYIGTYKTASTYYKTLLLDNGWNQVWFKDINWDRDHVFGFINDPVVRYMKGVVQDLYNWEDPALVDKAFDIISNHKNQLLLLSEHSMPICLTLKEYVNRVDWIPINEETPSHQLFLKLLAHYGFRVSNEENIDPNHSGQQQRDMVKEYAEKFKDSKGMFNITFAGDIDLYESVRSKINLNGPNWSEISWLRNNNE